jgi:HEAT repeat protein
VAKSSRRVRRDPFHLNEPAARVPGGVRRPSVTLAGDAFVRIRARQRLQRLLLQHDPDGPPPLIAARDIDLLRQLATEGAAANHVPAIRRGAMMLLAAFPTPENLTLLTELAVFGEDFYVRGHALMALGQTGLSLAAPLLREALGSDEAYERQAASAGLRLLGKRAGTGILAALRVTARDAGIRAALARVIATIEGEPRKPQRRRTSAREQ